jgi:hypothetical protein
MNGGNCVKFRRHVFTSGRLDDDLNHPSDESMYNGGLFGMSFLTPRLTENGRYI